MIYFFLGHDNESKDRNIADLKKKLFTAKDAVRFDYEILHAHKLESDVLKKALIALPAIAKKRLVVIRESQKLRAHHKDIIIDVFLKADHPCILILDYNQAESDDVFIKKLKRSAKVFHFQKGQDIDVFDLADAINLREKTQALKLLSELLSDGDHPLQIIGGLVWSWGRSRNRISPKRFNDGLLAFQEADVNIKRSRLKAEHAVEVLVVKLCSL